MTVGEFIKSDVRISRKFYVEISVLGGCKYRVSTHKLINFEGFNLLECSDIPNDVLNRKCEGVTIFDSMLVIYC